MKRDLRALVEAVKVAEEFKPSQHAKRVVFAKYGIIGSSRDQLLTAIFYDVMKRLGVIDKIVREVANVPSPLILDPWLRAALRVAVDLLVFHRLSRSSKHFLKWIVADFISSKTHPYVGMYYWQVFEKIESYKPKAESEVELLEYKYLLPAWFIEKMEKQLGRKEAEELFKALNEKPLLSVRVNTLKASVEEVVRELEREGKKPIVSKRVPTIVKFEGPYNFDKSRLYREGKIVIQEEASAVAS
ncbi:MAG TPA: Fmu (Sun) domain-containing protein, partial [Pyrodictium sp.]|nr:Fmu (Sun) domain-containing protein [Pyrodictium sp.]